MALLSSGRIVAYSAGAVGAALALQAFNANLAFYYETYLGLPYEYLTILLAVSSLWNAIANPLFGQLSDRTKTRFGRRLPYLVFGAVPLGLFTWLTWTPLVRGALPMAVQLGVVTFCFDSLYTLTVLNWTALFPEMFASTEQRAAVSALRQAFGILALVLGVALTQSVAVWLGGWSQMGAVFGTVAAATLLLSAWGAQENPTYALYSLKTKDALRETFQNASFDFYIAACFFVQFVFAWLSLIINYFAEFTLGIGVPLQRSFLLLAVFVVALPMAVLGWPPIVRHIGARRALMLAISCFMVALTPFFFVKGYFAAVATTAALGIGLSGMLVLPDVLLSDIIDEDELRTYARREGLYFGINGFVTRIVVTVAALVLALIQRLYHFQNGTSLLGHRQPPEVAVGFRLGMTVVPEIALGFALISVFFYPLTQERLVAVRQTLSERHG